jgi:hypothetical protein
MLPLLATLLFTATAAAPADSPVVTLPESSSPATGSASI